MTDCLAHSHPSNRYLVPSVRHPPKNSLRSDGLVIPSYISWGPRQSTNLHQSRRKIALSSTHVWQSAVCGWWDWAYSISRWKTLCLLQYLSTRIQQKQSSETNTKHGSQNSSHTCMAMALHLDSSKLHQRAQQVQLCPWDSLKGYTMNPHNCKKGS